MQALSDEALRAKTKELQDRYQDGQTLDALLPEAFAVRPKPCCTGVYRKILDHVGRRRP